MTRNAFPFGLLMLLQMARLTARGADDSLPAQHPKAAPALTNRCSIQHTNQNWWLITPEGRPFFSLGVCCVNRGLSRKGYDPEAPGYAAWQHYDSDLGWADATLKRLKGWGFTTVGAWADQPALQQSKEMTLWLTPVLHLGSSAGAPWWDMWSPKVLGRMDTMAREQILAVRDDPHLLGYYTDNELGWWNATLFKMTLEQSAESGQRQRLLQLLRATYQNDWKRLLEDFEPENAENWMELDKSGMLYLRPGGHGIKVMRQFLGILADRYYQVTRQIIRKYDQRALILGDRYQSFYYPEVAQAAAPYVDAISSNLNASWNDGTFLRSYLDTLHALTGKPILISEFYLSAAENRSGNKNSQGGFPVVTTQAERAQGFSRTLTGLLRLPYVIGADWFQYSDEPTHGREDGENFNFGLVDIRDQPYTEVTSCAVSLDINRVKALPLAARVDASDGIPRAEGEPMGELQPGRALKHWDRERGFIKSVSDFPLADLYVCWTPQALYLGLYSLDIIEEAYYRSHSVPKNDRPAWTVRLEGQEFVRARLGAGREPLVSDLSVRVQNVSGLNLNVHNVAIMEVPARRLGKKTLKAGDSISLSSSLLTHAQAYRVDWEGKFRLK